ncbi:hypothetical protein M413DRAFT_23319 [Hebeloma cylindrosporum]|uniref:Rhodopsin domain-containing protein n=1 Tax=Hebeloma cylindrosporum TaxID=76867 RepID=A0A0C3CSG8_HEBCY|nr:hypothetical protein M413DRAFT_23319 [Hebeloma cylindrosporum h7]
MLNPPLSLLSDDLLAYIVEHTAKLRFGDRLQNLNNLSLADRAFTQACQKYIFWVFKLSSRRKAPKKLKKLKNILDDKPTFAHQFRRVELALELSAWLFDDQTFNSILPLLANSPVLPHALRLGRLMGDPTVLDDPIVVVRWFTQSFFSQSVTVLHLDACRNIPLPIFLSFPRLREVFLDHARTSEKTYDQYPDDLCCGREAPSLEVLNYWHSRSLLEQMISPPLRFSTPVVLWSNLLVLTLSPQDEGGISCLQPILDAACDALQELYLTNWDYGGSDAQQLPLAKLVNLSKLPNLHVFSLYAIIKCKIRRKAARPVVLHDINTVLRTIPGSNKITNLWFDFSILGRRPFHVCLEQDWVGIFKEIIRISGSKALELEFQMGVAVEPSDSELHPPGEDELYMHITEKAASLSDYPKICTHFWNPTFLALGFTCLRLVHRWRTKQMWWDDYSAFIPLTVDVIYIVLTWLRFRDGVAGITEMEGFLYSDWFGVALGWTVIWGSRISLSLSIARVFPEKHTCRRFLLGLSTAFFLSYIGILFATAIPCKTAEGAWYDLNFNRKDCIKHLGGRIIALLSTFILDFSADILLVVTPLMMLWRVKLPTKERRLILALFASSLITLLSSITFSIIWALSIDHGVSSVILISMFALLQAGLSLLICNLLIITMLIYRFVLRKFENDIQASRTSPPPVATTQESTSNKNETNESSADDSEKSTFHPVSLTSINGTCSGISSVPPATASSLQGSALAHVVGEGELGSSPSSSQMTGPPWSFSARSSYT